MEPAGAGQLGLQHVVEFETVELATLRPEELGAVFHCLGLQRADANELAQDVAASSVAGILTTPLMATLLVVRRRADRRIPRDAAGFLSTLFSTLLRRHDASKPGFSR
jgi:hypothetical protein